MGPVDFAKYLCDAAELTTEQRGPVALVARDMQVAYDAEVARRATLTASQLRAEGIGASEHVTPKFSTTWCLAALFSVCVMLQSIYYNT